MRKIHKNIIGIFGLIAVLLMTAFAATIPSVGATSEANVTDVLTMHVVEGGLHVNITKPTSDSESITPEVTVEFDYVNVEGDDPIVITLTDPDGNVYTITEYYVEVTDVEANVGIGSGSYSFDIEAIVGETKYGEYTLKLATNTVGTYTEDIITLYFQPVTVEVKGAECKDRESGYCDAEIGEDGIAEVEGNVVVEVENNDDIVEYVIEVFDENGNSVITPIHQEVDDEGNAVFTLPLDDLNLPAGVYTITVTGYDADGDVVYIAHAYVRFSPIPEVPDTGNLLKSLNISKSDYLTTGLIIFGLSVVLGLFIIFRRSKRS